MNESLPCFSNSTRVWSFIKGKNKTQLKITEQSDGQNGAQVCTLVSLRLSFPSISWSLRLHPIIMNRMKVLAHRRSKSIHGQLFISCRCYKNTKSIQENQLQRRTFSSGLNSRPRSCGHLIPLSTGCSEAEHGGLTLLLDLAGFRNSKDTSESYLWSFPREDWLRGQDLPECRADLQSHDPGT